MLHAICYALGSEPPRGITSRKSQSDDAPKRRNRQIAPHTANPKAAPRNRSYPATAGRHCPPENRFSGWQHSHSVYPNGCGAQNGRQAIGRPGRTSRQNTPLVRRRGRHPSPCRRSRWAKAPKTASHCHSRQSIQQRRWIQLMMATARGNRRRYCGTMQRFRPIRQEKG